MFITFYLAINFMQMLIINNTNIVNYRKLIFKKYLLTLKQFDDRYSWNNSINLVKKTIVYNIIQ